MNGSKRPFGFNVIGNLAANNGLGVAARNVLDLVLERGYPLAAYNLPAGLGRDRPGGSFEPYLVDSLAALPYRINLFVLPLADVPVTFPRLTAQFDHEAYFNACVCFWELPTIPPRAIPALESLDALIACSSFMAHVYRCSLSHTAIVEAAFPVKIPSEPVVSGFREACGIPQDGVVFITTFDPLSDPIRKNATAAVHAFLRGAGDEPGAFLVVRVNNAQARGPEHEVVEHLRQTAGQHPRVIVSTAPLEYADVIGMYATSDVLVSLHRAEGLGLSMAEAMLLGKPVIATAWSGNLSFMDRTAACLVGYRLLPVAGTTAYDEKELEESTVWADPDVEEAAMWISRLATDAGARARIGNSGRVRMERFNCDARRGLFLEELRALDEQEQAYPRSRGVRDAQSAGRLSRLAQYQALERELEWIKSRPSYRLVARFKHIVRQSGLKRLLGVERG